MTSNEKTPVAKMTTDEYRDRLHNYSPKFLHCKDIRHVWAVSTPYTPFEDNPSWIHRVLTCRRCGTVRTDTFHLDQMTRRMERGGSTYRYPAGFSLRGLPQERGLAEIMRYESYLRALQAVRPENDHKEKNR